MTAAAALVGFILGLSIAGAILWWRCQRLRRPSGAQDEPPLAEPAQAALAPTALSAKEPIVRESSGSAARPCDSDRRSLIDVCVWTIMSINSPAVRQRLVDTLAEAGVQLFKADGLPFDVAWHLAIGWEKAPSPSLHRHVARTVRPGVRDGEVVIRPAEVVVYRKTKGRGNGIPKSQGA
jgi:hypothetical protein